jgi:hypothetical protein
MSNRVREKAVHAVDILNDFIGDLIGGTMLLRHWAGEVQAGRYPQSTMLNVQKICVSHLVLTLCKFVEFYQRFKSVIPPEYQDRCKALLGAIDQKGVVDFRHKYVGHIWDKDRKRPLMHSEILAHLDQMTDGDMSGFLAWVNNPGPDESPFDVVSIVETVRDALRSKHSIQPNEITDR